MGAKHLQPLLAPFAGKVKVFRVYTTLDKQQYLALHQLLKSQIAFDKKRYNIHSGSVVVLDAQNRLRVMIGSPDFFDTSIQGALNMAVIPRSTGSTLKPFLYALAVEEGFSPVSELRDIKRVFPSGYFPRNFHIEEENGLVRFREALANSYNIAAVDLLTKIGVERFYRFCEALGISFTQPPKMLGLSLILGAGEASLLSLTRAYSVFPRKGVLLPLQFFTRVTDEKQQPLLQYIPTPPKRVLSVDSAE